MAIMRNRSPRNSNGKNRSGSGRQNGGKRNNHSNNSANLTSVKTNYEKYTEKAKEARSSGDRVSAENYLQYADHYKRILIEAEERKESVQAAEYENIQTEEKRAEINSQQLENPDNSTDIIAERKNNTSQKELKEGNAS
ncbi:MAG: DUF4167 domain-containing protein [Rickettsiales bacterium]|nr:DUF4167 domain-containing protein [Pseudomonadota bacterium]MDA0967372.1 DUF4167 domain-containing protein [Pseudomonadota bacterium]MDG4544396.1 DUF4167 domain-containing protein [Rickettsiales bacterium]MDG4546526.1 DUF4167 domain-containing protein [Rickettsiales bacterium]MDG4548671.1 DUF4167 domain-containing protein [Rickettsiales bacterium]